MAQPRAVGPSFAIDIADGDAERVGTGGISNLRLSTSSDDDDGRLRDMCRRMGWQGY